MSWRQRLVVDKQLQKGFKITARCVAPAAFVVVDDLSAFIGKPLDRQINGGRSRDTVCCRIFWHSDKERWCCLAFISPVPNGSQLCLYRVWLLVQ
jgi:hypothetical protein